MIEHFVLGFAAGIAVFFAGLWLVGWAYNAGRDERKR